MKALSTPGVHSQFSALGSGGMLRLLAAGALAVTALTGCGDSDSKGSEESGRGSLEGGGAGAGTGGTNDDDDTPDCGVDGSTIRRLSPSPDEDVTTILSVDGNIIFGTSSGLYRLPAGGTSAPERILEGSAGNFFANGSQIGVMQVASGSAQLSWVPAAGGASTTVALPISADVAWSFDKARNALFAVTSERPLIYSSHDLTSGQTQEFATELQLRSIDSAILSPSAVLVLMTPFENEDLSQLYSIAKGATTPLALAPDFAQKLRFAEVDEDNVYVRSIPNDTVVTSGHFRVPINGSSPAVAIAGLRGRVDSQRLYGTEQGMFGQDYDGRSYKVFPVGAAAVGETLFEYSCGTSDGLAADEDNIYLVVSPGDESWLLTVPRR